MKHNVVFKVACRSLQEQTFYIKREGTLVLFPDLLRQDIEQFGT